MKPTRKELLNTMDEFVTRQTEPFDFGQLLAFAKRKLKKVDADLLFDLACDSDTLFECDQDGYDDQFMPRHIFFKDAEFRITPLPEEIDEGVLVPGHRFMPFLSRNVFPAEVRLILPDGTRAKTRTVVWPQALTTRFLTFYGEYKAIEYLIKDHPENSNQLMPPFDQPLRLTVFDLGNFFTGCGFQPGDSLMLSVKDALKGIFSVRHFPAPKGPLAFSMNHAWIQTLKEAFEEASLNRPGIDDCHEQMAKMLFFAANCGAAHVLKNPPLPLAAFFSSQTDWDLQTLGDHSFFWPKDEDPSAAMLDYCTRQDPVKPESELDAYFQLLGLSLSLEEATAYIRDALADGATDARQPLARIISGRDLHFPSSAEQKNFHRLWAEFFDEVKTSYSAENDPFRDLRRKFLFINDKCLQTMRKMDAQGMSEEELLANPAFMEFNHITALIASALTLFNDPEAEEGSKDDLSEDVTGLLSSAVDDLCKRLLS